MSCGLRNVIFKINELVHVNLLYHRAILHGQYLPYGLFYDSQCSGELHCVYLWLYRNL